MGSPRRQVEELFLLVVDKGPAERSAILDGTRIDSSVRTRVESLLKPHDSAGDFLNEPAFRRVVPEGLPDLEAPRSDASPPAELAYLLDPCDTPGCLGCLAHYEVFNVLGRGGMGIVLRGVDVKLNREVAIKVLAPHLAADAAARTRVLREARAAAAVSHPHVITIFGVGETRGLPYLVMEYVPGPSLQQVIDAGSLSLTQILRIGVQVASGLAAAHAQGLVHRDIKPANILLEAGVERAKLTDFGLARAVDDVWITREGAVYGTPLYMSPEQGRGGAVDQRSDLFSLGGVMYAMCTGLPPFRGETSLAVLRQVCDEPPPPIRGLNAEIPEALARIVETLLAKDPDDRFPSAGAVAEILSRYLVHFQQDPLAPFTDEGRILPPPAAEDRGESNPAPRGRRTRRRPRGWLAVAAATLLAAITTVAVVKATRRTHTTGPVASRGEFTGTAVPEVPAISSPPTATGLWLGHPLGATDRPVKVFILAGDSNMSGRPQSRLLKADPARTREFFGHLIHERSWVVRDDVWVKYLDRSGSLTVGFGQSPERFGPELEFGQVVGDRYREQVLIIKTCWGGHRLSGGFRSPRMGPAPAQLLEEIQQELRRQNPDATIEDARAHCGSLYQDMLTEIRQTLANLGSIFPAYRGQGYELDGFVWFSGWNDMVAPSRSFGYSQHLADFIRDVRADLATPHLPLVLGQMGASGKDGLDQYDLDFRAQQAAVADLPEFVGNVSLVPTDPFWDHEAHAIYKKGWREHPNEWGRVGSDHPFHYLGSAKTIVLIGRAFGQAMISLQRPDPRNRDSLGFIWSGTREGFGFP